MKKIIKNPDPSVIQELLNFIQSEKTASIIPIYENFRKKNELRESLLKEQGYICCFCMQRIKDSNETTKIAHIFPQNPILDEDKQKVEKENLDLDYYNMLAACDGGKGQSPHLQHCDTKQGNAILKINPANPTKNCEELINYRSSGEIYSNNSDIDYDLREVLNLNLDAIKQARKEAYSAIIKTLESKYPNRSWSKRSIENEIKNYSQLKKGRYAPYCQYVIYFLEKKLLQLS
jgi:uncharacterized protein (TIGR02646 family)